MKLSRLNLGPIRKKVSVMYDLATHDIAIALYLLDQVPKFVSAQGFRFEKNNKDDWFQIQLFFDKSIVNIECFWLNQLKERKVSIHFTNEVITFDDLAKQQVKIYKVRNNLTEIPIIENIILPAIKIKEPLLNQIETFFFLIKNKSKYNYKKNAHFTSLITGVLETAMKSKNESGLKIPFKL
jgi:predicted dehydrogenase